MPKDGGREGPRGPVEMAASLLAITPDGNSRQVLRGVLTEKEEAPLGAPRLVRRGPSWPQVRAARRRVGLKLVPRLVRGERRTTPEVI